MTRRTPMCSSFRAGWWVAVRCAARMWRSTSLCPVATTSDSRRSLGMPLVGKIEDFCSLVAALCVVFFLYCTLIRCRKQVPRDFSLVRSTVCTLYHFPCNMHLVLCTLYITMHLVPCNLYQVPGYVPAPYLPYPIQQFTVYRVSHTTLSQNISTVLFND